MWTLRRLIAGGIGTLAALALAGGVAAHAADRRDPKKPPAAPKAAEAPAPEPAGHPEMPVPPDPSHQPPLPPRPPKTPRSDGSSPRYTLEAGKTNIGDLYLFKESVVIRGVQKGDLIVFGRELDVTGTVTGDIVATCQSVELGGKMGDSVRAFSQSVRVTGDIDGDLLAVGESIIIEKSARITGDLNASGARIEIDGQVEGDVDATGGEVHLSGEVGGSAELKGDVVEVDSQARVAGDLNYTARNRLDLPERGVVHGEVNYTPEKHKPHVSSGGVVKWFFFMATALLTGLVSLAMFRRSSPEIIAAVRGDGLRSAGIGFITAIVLPVALAISCILIITIPAVLLAMLAYGLLLYLAQVPVAVFVGEWLLQRLGRAASPFTAVAVGMPVLYLIFKIPVIGTLALFATVFTGFGAIVVTIWSARQARRAGAPPVAPLPPAVPVSA